MRCIALPKLLMVFPFFLTNSLSAQQPVLKVAGKDSAKVELKKFTVTVNVTGTIAITTMEMQFCNSANRVLEGELTFPMPEGVSISRYALDINGRMREAVPVEKEKGQVVFENIERRNVDPGLLEKTTGNTFRTRIYPIPANGCRTIIVGYQQQLTLADQTAARYDLPLHFKAPIDRFNIDFKVLSGTVPEVGKDCTGLLQFDKQQEVYHAAVSKKNYIPDANFSIVIPQWPDAADAMMQPQRNGSGYHFIVNSFPVVKPAPKPLPSSIGILWDVSLSGLNRNQAKAFELLDAYFKKNKNTTVLLATIGYTSAAAGIYAVNGGNWSSLKEKLTNLTYDGATNFGLLKDWLPASEYLFFTDGLNTYGNSQNMLLPGKPVHTINASPNADFGMLKYIAGKTGGSFVNLEALPVDNAVQLLTEQQLQFMGIAPNAAVSELYPLQGTPVAANCIVTGVSNLPATTVTLLFGDGKSVLYQKEVVLKVTANPFIEVDKLWAQQKIAALELQYDQNKEVITELGKKYGLVTQNTSLIVLDAVEDYVRYEIEPPAELRGAYDKLMKEQLVRQTKQDKQSLDAAANYYKTLTSWWMKDFTVKKPIKPKGKLTVRYDSTRMQNIVVRGISATSNVQTSYNFSPSAAMTDSVSGRGEQVLMAGYTSGLTIRTNESLNGAFDMSQRSRADFAGATSQIQTVQIDDDEKSDKLEEVLVTTVVQKPEYAYLKKLDSIDKGNLYAAYLNLRAAHILDPVFYCNIANRLFAIGDTATGLQVLSNIADLNYDDHELYKMLGYRLKSLGRYHEALNAFRKVLQWRPQEPQSYRDYGLALADAGLYQQALDTLYLALTRNFDEGISNLYPGIEEIIVTEINNLIALHGQKLNTSRIDKRLLRNLPSDIRVVLNWNMNDSDIDLWVIDPSEEKCYFSNKITAMGGRISADFTRGYGPEQFMLKKAPKGKYKVMLDYYGDSQQKIAGPATVMAEIFINYGKPNQQRKVITLQMKKENEDDDVLISEFTF